MIQMPAAETALLPTLKAVPRVDIGRHVRMAMGEGWSSAALLWDVMRVLRGPGKLTPPEYFYYRLWDPQISSAEKLGFVGKKAQHLMHVACNDSHWYQTAADKILFHTIMGGARLPIPPVLGITQPGRTLRGALSINSAEAVAKFLRDPAVYPFFAKPVAGKYSLNVISAESYERETDSLILLNGARQPILDTARAMAEGAGYIIQSRLRAAGEVKERFGPRLWSARLLIFIRPCGPHIHRAVAKIATGLNPADNYWRPGNMLGAVDLATGTITGVVRGSGAGIRRNETHPDTGHQVVGFVVPDWSRVRDLALEAARIFPGIRTQSWDIAMTENGPVILEVNFGGDLNLAQLAEGRGVLDDAYHAHLQQCGFKF